MRLLGWFLAGAVALCCYLALYERANPEASINLTTDREAALSIAEGFLQEQGWDVADYRSAVTFGPRHSDKEYLEKELPLDEANRLMRDEVSVWGWYCRWYRFEEVEELWVRVSPDGRIVGFWHQLEEAAPGAALDAEQATEKAEAFLSARQAFDLDEYTLVIEDQRERPNRVDHYLTWERKDFRAKDATSRVSVSIQGDQVGHFSEHLKLPEEWLRNQDSESALRGTVMGAATIGYWLLCVAAGVVLLLELRGRRLRAGFGLAVVMVLTAIHMAEWANWWPLRWISYDTTDTFGAFVGDEALGMLSNALTAVLAVLAFALPGESLGRRAFPDKAPLSKMLRGKFWSSREVFIASLVGGCLAMLHAAYVTCFYVGAEKLGAWSPQGWPYWDILATPYPWIYPLTVGLSAAINEEFTFRLFAIALLLRVTKRRWVAILVPAVIWAFLHTNYPQEPVYIRGVELTVVGIVYGLVFVRYGLFATFVSHVAFNALTTSQILLRSGDLSLQASGVAALSFVFVAIVPGIVTLLRGRRLSTNDEVWADGESVIRYPVGANDQKDAAPEAFRPYMPLSRPRWLALILLTLCSGLALPLLPREEDEPFARVAVDRREARAIADAFLQEKGVDTAPFRTVVTFYEDLDGAQFAYSYRHIDKEDYVETCRERLPGYAAWRVGYFRPREKEAYQVRVLPNGEIFTFTHVLPEDAPGAQLTRDEALSLAEDALRARGIPIADYRLVTEHLYERPARNDHTFEWEDTTAEVGEGSWRVRLRVQGDEPEAFWSRLEVPEAWVLKHHKREFRDTLKAGASMGFGVLGIAALVWMFVRYFLHRAFDWRGALPVAAACTVALLLQNVNGFTSFWHGYRTSTSPVLFMAWQFFSECILLPLAVFFGGASLFGLCEALFRRAFPQVHPVSHWFGRAWPCLSTELGGSRPRRLPLKRVWGEAIVVGFLTAFVLGTADELSGHLDAAEPVLREALAPVVNAVIPNATEGRGKAPSLSVEGGNDTFLPAVDAGCMSVSYVCVFAGMALGTAGLYRRILKRRKWPLPLLIIAIGMLMAAEVSTTWRALPSEAVILCAEGLIFLAVLWALVRWFLRDNVPAYFMGVFLAWLFDEASRLTRAANGFEQANGWALYGFVGGVVVFGIYLILRSRTDAHLPTPARVTWRETPTPLSVPEQPDEGGA